MRLGFTASGTGVFGAQDMAAVELGKAPRQM